MKKRMAYGLYKTGYSQFPAADYDRKTKTILVDLPEISQHKIPTEWKKTGNHYSTSGGCTVYFWSTGLARNYMVEDSRGNCETIPAGIDSFERVLAAVEEMERR